MSCTRHWLSLTLLVAMCLTTVISTAESVPMPRYMNGYYNEVEDQPEEVLMELIAKIAQIIRTRNDMENSKRAVDFGLARGFSGIQEAKHRLGLAAASYAGGPGRKRRSEPTQSN